MNGFWHLLRLYIQLLGISQPEVSHLMNGEFQRFSEGKLLIFLKRLDTEITLHLRPLHAGDRSAGTVILL
ncbi:MAG TPA: hypothetical protein DCY88_00835 [Cyanobacteria bacterium UBA11372]|nr:hypothetical protein [Cyanobacteria bacterium UBA11372]